MPKPTSKQSARSKSTKTVVRPSSAPTLWSRLWGVVLRTGELLPILIPAVLAVFGTIAIGFLLADRFDTVPVLTIGGLAALVTAVCIIRYYPKTPHTNREWHIGNLLVILGVLAWGAFNIPFTSQHVFTDRDPATYAVAGEWLISHDSLRIPVPTEFGQNKDIVVHSSGFGLDANNGGKPFVYAQGLHLLPALVGLIGRAVGQVNMLHANILFGMTALLAVYGFARLFVRARWALVAVATLAASMPLIYFSRDMFTEPLAATFVFGSLSLLWLAVQEKRGLWWFLAGLVAGAGALARIDAYLAYVGLILFGGIWVALAAKADRRSSVRQVSLAAIGLIVPSVVGWLDASQLSRPYYMSLTSQFYHELAALVLAAVLGAVLVYIAWHTALLKRLDQATRAWRQPAIVMGIIGILLVLSCRPFVVWALNRFQNAGHLPPGYTFSEITTYWVSWYLGPLLTIAGVAGITLAAAWASVRRDLLLVASILVITTTAFLYFLQPSISPDQVWAARRFLPVVFPGVAVFGALALDWLSKRYIDKERFGYLAAALVAGFIITGALFVSSPLVLLREMARLGPVEATCQALPKNAAVLLVGTAKRRLTQPIRTFCNVPAMAYQIRGTNTPSRAELREVARVVRASGHQPIVGVAGGQMAPLLKGGNQLTDVSNYSYRQLEQTFLAPPQRTVTITGSLYFGVIQPNGTVRPL